MGAGASFGSREGLGYGLLGLPLAFVALPLYVQLPHYYASEFGLSLSMLGTMLLFARLLDALIDPLLGRWVDQGFRCAAGVVLQRGAWAAVALALGLAGLFLPPVRGSTPLLVWSATLLLLTYAGYSVLSIAHQSWGARLGGDEAQRARIFAWREGAGLVGVVLASVLPAVAGIPALPAVFAVCLAIGWLAWTLAPRPPVPAVAPGGADEARPDLWLAWRRPAFRGLVAVFLLNGVASAIPATLALFFMSDRLQAPAALQGYFLAAYFLAAAVGLPVWTRLVRRLGLARVWLLGMVLSVAVFAWAAVLGTGDFRAYATVCVLSGVSLGCDLALPGALLAGVIAQAGHRGQHEGAYFGWWNFASKLNLALAAGLALPLLAVWGYEPGSRDAAGLEALSWAYAVLPCVLKLLAALALMRWMRRDPRGWRVS